MFVLSLLLSLAIASPQASAPAAAAPQRAQRPKATVPARKRATPAPAPKPVEAAPVPPPPPPPPPPDPNRFDGIWVGKTAQDKALRLTIREGKITDLDVAGKITGRGCSSETTLKGHPNSAIHDESFLGGAVSGDFSATAQGRFVSPELVHGKLFLQLDSDRPYTPPCFGQVVLDWSATKEGSAAATPFSGEVPCPVGLTSTAPPTEMPPEEPSTPGTIRLYPLSGSYGSKMLIQEPSSGGSMFGVDRNSFGRELRAGMVGNVYKISMVLQSFTPRGSAPSPEAKIAIEVVLKKPPKGALGVGQHPWEGNGAETVLAATQFTAGPETKRYTALVTGSQPQAVAGDYIVVRTRWEQGAVLISLREPPFDSFVDVPQTSFPESPFDRLNRAWIVTGTVFDQQQRPMANRTVLLSPIDPLGQPRQQYLATSDGFASLNNPRPRTDAQGRFRVRLARSFFYGKADAPMVEGEAVLAEECGVLDVKRLSEPLRFRLDANQRTVDIGSLRPK